MPDSADEPFTVENDGRVVAYIVGTERVEEEFDYYLREAREVFHLENLDIKTDATGARVLFMRPGVSDKLPDHITKQLTDLEEAV